jgi:hypothetical protein
MQRILAQKQIEAAKLQKDIDDNNKKNYDMTIELIVDKFGRKEAARVLKDDIGYKEVYKGYLAAHPEFKGVDNIEATLPIATRKEIDQRMTEQIERIKEDIKNKRLPNAQDLAQMAALAEMAKSSGMMKPDEYRAVIGSLATMQKGVMQRLSQANNQQTSALAQPQTADVVTGEPEVAPVSSNTNPNSGALAAMVAKAMGGVNPNTQVLSGSTQYQTIKPIGKIKSFKRVR